MRLTSGMSTGCPRHLQLPLTPRTLLIADVTQLQAFIVGGEKFRENIETLVSYNIRNDRSQQDCPLYRAGSFNDTYIIYDVFHGNQPSEIRRSNMDTSAPVFYAAGFPALISTGITCIYLLLKSCLLFVPCHIPTKPKGGWQRPRQVVLNMSTAQIREKKATGKFAKQVSECYSEHYGRGTQWSQGSISLPTRRKRPMPPFLQRCCRIFRGAPCLRRCKKNCQAEGVELPKTIMTKNPVTHILTPKEYLQKVASGKMPPMNNHQMMQELAENATANDNTKFMMMEFRDVENTGPASFTKSTKTPVAHASLQTDSCDTLYVTKNTLTAYTTAVGQNAQAIQYDQMPHSFAKRLEIKPPWKTPLKAEELMTTHFNLAVLANELDTNKTTDAQNPEANTIDAEPSASAADEETYIKIPSHNYSASCDTKKQHPTGAVVSNL